MSVRQVQDVRRSHARYERVVNRNDWKGLALLVYYSLLGPSLFLIPYFTIRLLIHLT